MHLHKPCQVDALNDCMVERLMRMIVREKLLTSGAKRSADAQLKIGAGLVIIAYNDKLSPFRRRERERLRVRRRAGGGADASLNNGRVVTLFRVPLVFSGFAWSPLVLRLRLRSPLVWAACRAVWMPSAARRLSDVILEIVI